MIYDVIEERLKQEDFLVPGRSLFREFMPAECKRGAFLRASLDGLTKDKYVPDLYRGEFQLIVRDIDPVDGNSLALRLNELATVEAPIRSEETEHRGLVIVKLFYPRTLPVRFPRLEGNGYEWSTRFLSIFLMKPKNGLTDSLP